MRIFTDELCWSQGRRNTETPETPARLEGLLDDLRVDKRVQHKGTRIRPDVKELLRATHTYLDTFKDLVADGGEVYDSRNETFFDRYSYTTALATAQASVRAAEHSLVGEKAFALVRPPGHHAHRTFTHGFCAVNNMIVAASALLRRRERVFILDIDVHRGCGTQDFVSQMGPGVYYFSIHARREWPNGGGCDDIRADNIDVVGLDDGVDDRAYIDVLHTRLVPALQRFQPTIVGISAGFDTFVGHTYGFGLTAQSYREVASILQDQRWFGVLEGGYFPQALYAGITSLGFVRP